jgi:lantibiotic modifying enzyme
MARVKEAHLRQALREVELEEDYNARTERFVEQLRDIGEQMERTADRIEEES